MTLANEGAPNRNAQIPLSAQRRSQGNEAGSSAPGTKLQKRFPQTLAAWEQIAGRKLTDHDGREIATNSTGFFRLLQQWAESPEALVRPRPTEPTSPDILEKTGSESVVNRRLHRPEETHATSAGGLSQSSSSPESKQPESAPPPGPDCSKRGCA